MACRNLGECVFGAPIDREFGPMVGAADNGQSNSTVPKLFRYMRYNPELSTQGLASLGLPQIEPTNVQRLDSVDHMDELQEVGRVYAKASVSAGHFGGFH